MELLLVESFRPMARILRFGLEENGFVVSTADDPDKAKDLLGIGTFDVILLDLPEEKELAVLGDWRRARITTPVLTLSIPGSRLEKLNDLGLGPGASLSKPFCFDDLLDRLRSLAQQDVSSFR